MSVRSVAAFCIVACACSSTRVVSVLEAERPPARAPPPTLVVDVDATPARLPLSVAGTSVAYADLDRALGRAVERATAPTAQKLGRDGGRRYQLFVELVEAHAEWSSERLVVRLTTRATFREATGNVYIAQTHARCRAAGAEPPEHGSRVVLRCADQVGSEIERWLSGVEIH